MTIADGSPIAVIADQREDHHPIVLADSLEQNAGDPEYAVVVMGADCEQRLAHGCPLAGVAADVSSRSGTSSAASRRPDGRFDGSLVHRVVPHEQPRRTAIESPGGRAPQAMSDSRDGQPLADGLGRRLTGPPPAEQWTTGYTSNSGRARKALVLAISMVLAATTRYDKSSGRAIGPGPRPAADFRRPAKRAFAASIRPRPAIANRSACRTSARRPSSYHRFQLARLTEIRRNGRRQPIGHLLFGRSQRSFQRIEVASGGLAPRQPQLVQIAPYLVMHARGLQYEQLRTVDVDAAGSAALDPTSAARRALDQAGQGSRRIVQIADAIAHLLQLVPMLGWR